MAEGGAPTWNVLIVEDDPDVAYVHRRVLERAGPYAVVGVADSGEEAFRLVSTLNPHLILLDFALAGMNGLTFLAKLRLARSNAEVIAVTAARDVASAREAVHFGVVDYLVKPFSPERLRQALNLFAHRMSALSVQQLRQEEVDRLCASGRRPMRWLPKGLLPARLEGIQRVLASEARDFSADEIADAVGVARVTARRYLEYLVVTGQASCQAWSSGPGRPRKLYRAHVLAERAFGRAR